MDAIWFARPAWLIALLPLALCWLWLFFGSNRRQGRWEQVVDSHLLAHVLVDRSRPGQRALWLTLLAAAWLLGVLALAGPMLGKPATKPGTVARAQVFLIEIPEQKELTKDLRRNFETAIEETRQRFALLPNHETAVLLYSRNPFLLMPPTTDRQGIDGLLQNLEAGLLPEYGARPERALTMAAEMLSRNGFGEADIFWITAGNIAEAAVGSPEFAGRVSILFYGNDERVLTRLAAYAGSTGAGFTRTRDGGIESFHEARPSGAPSEKALQSENTTPHELAPALILLILPLAILAYQSGVLLVFLAFVLSLGLAFPEDAIADNPSISLTDLRTWREWQYGDKALAAEQFVDPCWRATASYRLGRYREAATTWINCPGADAAFNRGNALARAGLLNEAVAAYDQALQLRSNDADFQFNRRVVQEIIKPPPPPPPPKPDSAPPKSAGTELSEEPVAGRKPSLPFDANRLSDKAGRTSPEKDRRFLRQVILLQDQHRKARPPIGSGSAAPD
jgi:Ca-activated chloride channel family protein